MEINFTFSYQPECKLIEMWNLRSNAEIAARVVLKVVLGVVLAVSQVTLRKGSRHFLAAERALAW